MATALNNNPPPTPTTAMVMKEPSSSSSPADEQQQQYLSSTSSTVSQSPIQEGSSEGGGDGADHSCSNDNNSDAATIILQQQRNSNNNNSTVIINPYKKQAPTAQPIHNQDPKVHRRRQFIEKYRLQSLHNNNNNHHRQGGGVMNASSRSALEVLRLHQQWRQQWRRRSELQQQQLGRDDSCTNDNRRSYNKQFALRPRLFLFQRMMQPRRMESNTMTSQQHQLYHDQQQGVWELGTGITELSGEGGSGKTQICLSLCMTCALTPLLYYDNNNNNASSSLYQTTQSNDSSNDDNNYTSIYITMGEGIPQSKVATRLHQMLHHRVPNIHNNNNNSNQDDDDHDDEVERILSRIWLLSLKNEDDFIEFVEIHLPNILNNQSCGIKPPPQQQQQQTPNNQYPTCHKVGFIAFDGIANFFRFSDPLFQQHSQSNNYNQKSMFHQHRSSKLFQISSLLRKMSDVYDVPIVITNQVTSNIPSDDGLLLKRPSDDMSSCMMGGVGQNNKIQPALGLIWSNCVTTRFILQRKDGVMAKISTGVNYDGGGESASENGNSNANKKEAAAAAATTTMQRVRKASVLQSVCTPEESEVWYVIDAGAVVAVSRAHRSDDR